MEHTNKFLQGMFAAYMGCECEITEIQDGTTKKIKSKMSGIVSERLHFDETGLFVHFSKIKQILTPLSEIADEDAIELAKIDDKNCDYKFGNNRGFAPDEYRVIFNGTASFVERYYKGRYITGVSIPITPSVLTIEQIDYLRSKKYDCGYLHISSLIQAGLAVKSTK
jgi:hypothetical protein